MIASFPNFSSIDLSMRKELHPRLSMLKAGISEFTFANLYLFRENYKYEVSSLPDESIAIKGQSEGKTFLMFPCGIPEKSVFKELMSGTDYIKALSVEHTEESRIFLEQNGYTVREDRDNFDYLYLRKDLVHLAGRKYHKKRNQIHAFINNYNYEEKRLCDGCETDAMNVLEKWVEGRDDRGDYKAAKEGLEIAHDLNLRGAVFYVNGEPAGYSLGEGLARGKMFAVHFEKAIGNYKGIYQFINKSFAKMLPGHYHHINREQDLGDPGLRQAKMSYRPCGFVKKYKIVPREV
ncbi:MAG: DUF2156 domain-containing protein [Spirochaetia bacterium]